jgi:hypothetical protein
VSVGFPRVFQRGWPRTVGTMRNEMRQGQGGNARQFCVGHGLASCPSLLEEPWHVHGMPPQRGIG